MSKQLLLGAALALSATGASAAIVNYNYIQGGHVEEMYLAGSNGAANLAVWGSGQWSGQSPQNKCVDGTTQSCASLGYVNGDNGTYMTNVGGATPVANFAGSLTYDTDQTFQYTDKVTNVTETFYKVTGGALTWTGTYGIEVTIPPTSGGLVGGSFFTYSWANGSINLLAGGRAATSKCDLGISGNAVVGALLCGFANPASGYAYANNGAYIKPTDWAGVKENANGTIELLIYGNRRTAVGAGNDLQERILLSSVPVPGAVWLFGSAIGLMGLARRRRAAA